MQQGTRQPINRSYSQTIGAFRKENSLSQARGSESTLKSVRSTGHTRRTTRLDVRRTVWRIGDKLFSRSSVGEYAESWRLATRLVKGFSIISFDMQRKSKMERFYWIRGAELFSGLRSIIFRVEGSVNIFPSQLVSLDCKVKNQLKIRSIRNKASRYRVLTLDFRVEFWLCCI